MINIRIWSGATVYTTITVSYWDGLKKINEYIVEVSPGGQIKIK